MFWGSKKPEQVSGRSVSIWLRQDRLWQNATRLHVTRSNAAWGDHNQREGWWTSSYLYYLPRPSLSESSVQKKRTVNNRCTRQIPLANGISIHALVNHLFACVSAMHELLPSLETDVFGTIEILQWNRHKVILLLTILRTPMPVFLSTSRSVTSIKFWIWALLKSRSSTQSLQLFWLNPGVRTSMSCYWWRWAGLNFLAKGDHLLRRTNHQNILNYSDFYNFTISMFK